MVWSDQYRRVEPALRDLEAGCIVRVEPRSVIAFGEVNLAMSNELVERDLDRNEREFPIDWVGAIWRGVAADSD
jgi:hypothetical protein